MTNINELTAKIRTVLSDEEVAKVETLLKDIDSANSSFKFIIQGLNDDIHALNHEGKTKKEKIRELSGQLETATDKITTLEGSADNPEQKKEFERLQGFEKSHLKSSRTKWAGLLESIKDHADFDMVKSKLILADDDTKFEDIADKDIISNLSVISDAQGYGRLGVKTPKDGKRPGGGGDDDKPHDPFKGKFGN